MDTKDIDSRFSYHPVTSEQATSLEDVRIRCAELAHAINTLLPDGREKSTALTYLEICMFFANAGISRSTDASSNQKMERSQ